MDGRQQAQASAAERRPASSTVERWRGELRDAILSRVLPRLVEDGGCVRDAGFLPRRVDARDVELFADLVLRVPVPDLLDHVDALRAGGLSVESAVLDLLVPAARCLGARWESDRLGFLDVTAGLNRLQGLLRALGPALDAEASASRHRILLAPVAGEQHVFGLSVVAAFFRRAGWEVSFEPRIGFDGLLALVAAERFAAVGLSVAGDGFLAGLPGQVEALRRASLDPEMAVLAGGPAFLLDPDLHRSAGVDGVARDAAEAVSLAEALVARRMAARACS